jgi:hypothetical protein
MFTDSPFQVSILIIKSFDLFVIFTLQILKFLFQFSIFLFNLLRKGLIFFYLIIAIFIDFTIIWLDLAALAWRLIKFPNLMELHLIVVLDVHGHSRAIDVMLFHDDLVVDGLLIDDLSNVGRIYQRLGVVGVQQFLSVAETFVELVIGEGLVVGCQRQDAIFRYGEAG